ncbi:MAG: dTMP kinase [Candidatus Omnitrophota bacterium]|nr:MAG: dTMP kinase [Candidatus Omnitrophota bacterium]
MPKKNLKKGIFITFEGPEGCGKSTHSKLMADFLRKQGYKVVYTREPGGTKLGDKIRGVLLKSKRIDISPLTEMLLFEASRAELLKEVIKPALLAKKLVITDRFNAATLVYQGYAGGVSLKDIKRVESVSIKGIKPDLTIVLDIGAEEGLRKIHWGRKDRMESKKISFHRKVRRGYLDLAGKHKKTIKIIKTRKIKSETFKEVKRKVMNVIQRYKTTE